MAAVVASLAAFVAGCGLPALPVPRGPNQDGNLSGEGDLSTSVAWCSAHRQAQLCKAATATAIGAAPAPSPVAEPSSAKEAAEASTAGLQDANAEGPGGITAVLKERPGALLKAPRVRRSQSGAFRVSFDLGKCTVHEVTPYAEVYGVHPREFNFARGRPAPAACFADVRTSSQGAEDDGSDSEEEDEEAGLGALRARAQKLLRVESIPWPVWSVALVLSFLVHAFGPEAFLELALQAPLVKQA
uniref:Uncharacterized protein n=1 Tax=Alexandrium monilatum TaxID=311494 RepID=A0A7S4SF67_9DINO